jgi:methylglutaconyl-CoA hydratase
MNVSFIDNVLRLSLNRPQVLNAFDGVMVRELISTLHEYAANPSLRVVVISGEGKAFCAGGDLNWLKSMDEGGFEKIREESLDLVHLFETIRDYRVPVIARVHGDAFGGGAGLVCACDIVIMDERAMMCFPEVRLGLVPAVISPFVIAKIGESRARELFFTGRRFDAREAQTFGIAHFICAGEVDLDHKIQEIIEMFLKGAPGALIDAKKLFSQLAAERPEGIGNLTARLLATRRVSNEGQEGMKALLEKRAPSWVKHGRDS